MIRTNYRVSSFKSVDEPWFDKDVQPSAPKPFPHHLVLLQSVLLRFLGYLYHISVGLLQKTFKNDD